MPAAHRNLATALVGLRRLHEAVACYDRAIELRPDFVQAHCGRAGVLVDLGRPREALDSCRRVLEMAPNSPDAYTFRGVASIALNRPAEAAASFDAALSLRPNDPVALNGRGIALLDLLRPNEAFEALSTAVAAAPGYAEAWSNHALALAETGRHDEGVVSAERAISLAPEDARYRLNAAHANLQLGRFERGWELYESRARLSAEPPALSTPGRPRWNGEPLAGKTLLIHSEQGLGDTMQFCRYARLAEVRGARVILSVQDRLGRLIRGGLSTTIEVIGTTQAPGDFDFHIPLLSLPGLFGTRLESIPAVGSYLFAEPGRVEHWRTLLPQSGLRVGVCWEGGGSAIGRSFPVSELQAVATLEGVRLINLQKDALPGAAGALPLTTLGGAFDVGSDAFIDTAAVMASVDLIITTDTSIAHLGGALGRPTWVMLKRNPDWRWLLERTDSPWYPSVRLFRQPRPGDWQGAFAQVRAAIQDFHFSK